MRNYIILPVISAIGFYYWFYRGLGQEKLPEQLNPQYDFIIVGGGTAGCVLAARLSEDPSNTVLLIEAGPHEYMIPFSHVPAAAPFLQQTTIDWQFATQPQKNSHLIAFNKTSFWPRGRVLGGTSILNFMLVSRGSRYDWNRIATNFKASTLAFDKILPYFKKSEKISFNDKSNLRGTNGPMPIRQAEQMKLAESLFSAAQEMGTQYNKDSVVSPDGYHMSQFFVDLSGRRASTASKYLRPIMDRFNLHVLTDSHVTKINFSPNGHAIGVQYLHRGKQYKVIVNNEIILSAGTIQTPQLLMLSGIGPKKHLDDMKIPLVRDCPSVGQHLADQLIITTFYAINDSAAINYADQTKNPWHLGKIILEYMLFGTGLIGTPPTLINAFISSGRLPKREYENDLQIYVVNGDPSINGRLAYLFNAPREAYVHAQSSMKPGSSLITLLVSVQHPRSRGFIQLKSNDPLDHPIIEPNYFDDDIDIEMIVDGLMHIDRLMSTESMRALDAHYAEAQMVECPQEFRTREYFKCMARHRATTHYHPTSTCRMSADAESSVVDTQFRVHGIKGLRIVDASVIPDTITGNPTAPVIALAEMAADMIKESIR